MWRKSKGILVKPMKSLSIKRKGKRKEYTCAACGLKFESEWSDKEAQEEAKSIWGDVGENPAVICDDCFQEGHKKIYEEL